MDAFELTDQFKEEFSGGTIMCSPQGHAFDIGKALENGNGVIVTDDPGLSSLLREYPALQLCDTPEDAKPVIVPGRTSAAAPVPDQPWTPQYPSELMGTPVVESLGEIPAQHLDEAQVGDPTVDPTGPSGGEQPGGSVPDTAGEQTGEASASEESVAPTSATQSTGPTSRRATKAGGN